MYIDAKDVGNPDLKGEHSNADGPQRALALDFPLLVLDLPQSYQGQGYEYP